jgi:maleate isomerase
MEAGMTDAAAVIRPGVPMDVVAYGCTSGTVVIGEENVFRRIHEAWPDAKCTTPITAPLPASRRWG